MDPTFSQVCLQMGVTGISIACVDVQCAVPGRDRDRRGLQLVIRGNSFAGSWAQALANGWKISTALMPTANIALMASTVPGPYRPRPVDPLFDDFA